MKILFVGMYFNNYEVKIKEEFENQGHSVDLVYDMPKSYFLPARLLSKQRIQTINYRYQNKVLNKIENNKYDIVFIIVGRHLSEDFLKGVKKDNTRIFLYLWDDVARVENFNLLKVYADRILSFDKDDCEKYGLEFLPLFYLNEFYNEDFNIEKKIDLYGVFWNHSDRLRIINQIIKQLPGKHTFFYILVGRLFFLRNLFSTRKEVAYHLFPMKFTENVNNMHKAKAVLDIQFPSQKGLTIRTIEALGCGIKLITTNYAVKQYDFYSTNNIEVIDRDNPIINPLFLESPYIPVNEKIREKYSLTNWIYTIIND